LDARAGAAEEGAGRSGLIRRYITQSSRSRGHSYDPRAATHYLEACRFSDTAVGVTVFLLALICAATYELPGLGAAMFTPDLSYANVALLAGVSVTWYGMFALTRLYDARYLGGLLSDARRVLIGTALASLAIMLLPLPSMGARIHAVPFFVLLAPVVTLTVRAVLRVSFGLAGSNAERMILILGNGPRGRDLLRAIEARPDRRERVMGFLDRDDRPVPERVAEKTLGGLTDLEAFLLHNVVDEVLIALPIKSCYADISAAIQTCETVGVDCRYLANLFDCMVAEPRYGPRYPQPMVTMKVVPDDYRLRVKRAIDIVGSALGLTLLAPIFIAVAIAVKLSSPGPAFFVQERHGLGRRRFRMLKFRSMVADAPALQASLESLNEADGPVFKMRDDPRVTPVGRFLRRTSLDELPQLINVLRGDMSLVGPRPLPERDVGRFSEACLLRRFSVKPGVTGLWQVSGRSDLDFDEWIRLDLKYIDEWSLGLELKILTQTLPAVLRKTGAA
jgi:exopolysaccharide biosynthesis polyprenyl glycosylphosphotransferase